MTKPELIAEIKRRERYLERKHTGFSKMKKDELERLLYAVQVDGLIKSFLEDCDWKDKQNYRDHPGFGKQHLYRSVFEALVREHKFTLEQLEQTSISNMTAESKADEYISRSCNASVWSAHGEGSIEIMGQIFEVKNVWLDSDARAL